MKKYEKLEQQIKEIQEEIDRLKKEEKEMKLPEGFDRSNAIRFIETPKSTTLIDMFDWGSTPQGEAYWDTLYTKLSRNRQYEVPQEVIIQIQGWVIESYKQQYGD